MPADALAYALLQGDADLVRALASDRVDARSTAARAFAEILDSNFAIAAEQANAATSHPDDGQIDEGTAVELLARTMLGVSASGELEVLTGQIASATTEQLRLDAWAVCVIGEAGMSAGRLDLAGETAARLCAVLADDDPNLVFAGQTHTRSLLFQGRLPEAAVQARRYLPLARTHRVDALRLVLLGTLAYIAALREDRKLLRDCVDEVEELAPSCPPGYFVNGAQVLSSYALAADGQGDRAAAMLLAGAGGPQLLNLQAVDRAYGYELLVTAALTSGDLVHAREWADRAVSSIGAGDEGSTTSSMTSAALHRIAARLAAAEGDRVTSVALAEVAAELASGSLGHLDATRARLMAGSALLEEGDPARAQARLREAGVDATQMGAVSLSMLARRDLRSIGLRFTGAEQAPMSRREREVAELVIAGHANAQIARALNVSERTVHSHVAAVLRALGVPSRAALARVLEPPPTGDTAGLLTARQQEVAELVTRGYTNEGIGRELGLSVKTVEKHLGDAFRRLDIDSRSALAALWAGRSNTEG